MAWNIDRPLLAVLLYVACMSLVLIYHHHKRPALPIGGLSVALALASYYMVLLLDVLTRRLW